MNYRNIYYNLISNNQLKNRTRVGDGSLESHHIVPKCMGGTNDSDNLVLLTPKEHYVAHHLLYKMHTGQTRAKLAYAFFKMCMSNGNQSRRITANQFNTARLAVGQACSGVNHPGYGVNPFTSDQIQLMRLAKQGVNNPMFGTVPWNKGLTVSTSPTIAAARDKRLETLKSTPLPGRNWTQTQRDMVAAKFKGVPKSEAHRQKLSLTQRGRIRDRDAVERSAAAKRGKPCPEHTCPHCGKIGKGSAMFKWHFDKCSTLKQITLQ